MQSTNRFSLNDTTLQDLLDRVFRNSHVVLPLLLAVTVAAAAYAVFKPRTFRTEATLLVRNERAQAVITPSESGSVVVGPVTENDIRTEVELLQSRDLLLDAAVQSGLLKTAANMKAAPAPPLAEAETTLQKLRRSLRVSPVMKADMIRVEYLANDAAEGPTFLNALLKVYQDRHIRLRSRAEVKLFHDEAERLALELRSKEKELAEFQRTTELHSVPEQRSLWLKKLMDSETALREAELRQAESRHRTAALESLVGGLPSRVTTLRRQVPNQYSTERLRTMLVELENKRIELLAKYNDGDRMVKQVDSQIALTKAALAEVDHTSAEEVATDLNPHRQGLEAELLRARADLAVTSSRLEILKRHISGYRTELARLESFAADHDALVREVRELGERYHLHARKSEESRIEAALDERRVTNVVVAQQPNVPVKPESRPYTAAAGLWIIGCSLILGGSFALGSRKVFHTPSDLENFTGVPVLGTVPVHQRGRA